MEAKQKLLIIAPAAFYNNVGQAGHKTLNYYTSKFENDFDVTVLSTADAWSDDFRMMEKDHPGVTVIGDFKQKTKLQKLIDYMLFNHIYPKLKTIYPSYYLTGGFFKRRLASILNKVESKDTYDYVLVEFTSAILQINLIKKYFPKAKFIASCHDVTFLSVERWLKTNSLWISKDKYYQSFKKLELNALNQYDLVVTQNQKDIELLNQEELFACKELHVINPYYDTYSVVKDAPDGIVFFGAMKRKENIDSLIWFLQNVWKDISEMYLPDLKLYVVGGGVTDDLRKSCGLYKNVIITGFVLDPTPYFNKSFAMIVPLQYGAGIKVKSIEALFAGIPLISNKIGIEGISAMNGKEYLHCETPSEWINNIKEIVGNTELYHTLSVNGRVFADSFFNLKNSYTNYSAKIKSL